MTFAERITIGGYNCAEVASAMQKCIRRGLEDDALFWATELDRSNFGEYVWKVSALSPAKMSVTKIRASSSRFAPCSRTGKISAKKRREARP
ncbi:MAG TPA: hypothetical protein VFD27_02335 [Chthoniobacteraceae bacterium]|nr:hypothetical protein [Chthoniobacteraceae bacterium]